MARPKEAERGRSLRIPLTEAEFQRVHRLAGDVPLTTYVRRLLEREAIAAGLLKAKAAK